MKCQLLEPWLFKSSQTAAEGPIRIKVSTLLLTKRLWASSTGCPTISSRLPIPDKIQLSVDIKSHPESSKIPYLVVWLLWLKVRTSKTSQKAPNKIDTSQSSISITSKDKERLNWSTKTICHQESTNSKSTKVYSSRQSYAQQSRLFKKLEDPERALSWPSRDPCSVDTIKMGKK